MQMIRKNEKNKIITILVLLTILLQIIMPILPMEVLATSETETENETEIGKEYEIKDEKEWDISTNQDGSIMAKWTRKDKTITITGTGEMKDWTYNATPEGVTSIGNAAFEQKKQQILIEMEALTQQIL